MNDIPVPADPISIERMEETDKLLDTLGAMEKHRDSARRFGWTTGPVIPLTIGVISVFRGSLTGILHALGWALFMLAVFWFSFRRWDKGIEEVERKIDRLSPPAS